MKRLLTLLVFLALLPAGCSNSLVTESGRVGTIFSCTIDTDVDTAFATTVDQDSAAAAKTLYLTATTNLAAGDTLLVDKAGDGDGKEVCVVASVSAGVSVTCVDNLTYTHLAATGDDVTLTNRIGPLNPGSTYAVQLVTSAEAPQAGRFLQGDQYVDTETNGGISTPGTLGHATVVVRASDKYRYISFATQAANADAKACLVQ